MDPTKQEEFSLHVDYDDDMLVQIAMRMANDFGITIDEKTAQQLVSDKMSGLLPLISRMEDALQVSFRDQLFRHMLEATKEGGL